MREETGVETKSFGLEVAQENYRKSLNVLFQTENPKTLESSEILSEDVKGGLKNALEAQRTYLILLQKSMGSSVDARQALNLKDNQSLPSAMDLDKPIDDLRMAGDILVGRNHNPTVLVEVIEDMATEHRADLDILHANNLKGIEPINTGSETNMFGRTKHFYSPDDKKIRIEVESYDRSVSNLKTVASVALTNAPLWAAGNSQKGK